MNLNEAKEYVEKLNIYNNLVPSGERLEYKVTDEGIEKVIETFDQYGESLYGSSQMIIPKEVFIAAYKKYIEDGE